MPRTLAVYPADQKFKANAHAEQFKRYKAIEDKQQRLGEDVQVIRVRPVEVECATCGGCGVFQPLPEKHHDPHTCEACEGTGRVVDSWVVVSYDRQEFMYGLKEDYGDDAPW